MSKPTIEEEEPRFEDLIAILKRHNIDMAHAMAVEHIEAAYYRIEARLGEGIPGDVQDLLCAVSDWVWGGELAWTGHSPELLKAFREKVRNQKARLGELEKWVRDDSPHRPACPSAPFRINEPCTCGLSALLEQP